MFKKVEFFICHFMVNVNEKWYFTSNRWRIEMKQKNKNCLLDII